MSPSPTTKVFVDWGKLLQIVIIITATVVLGVAGIIGSEAVIGIMGLAAGYVFGNGKSAREGIPMAPLLGVRARPAEVAEVVLEVVDELDGHADPDA